MAPRAITGSAMRSAVKPDSATICAPGRLRSMAGMASRPSHSGIERSSRTTSGCSSVGLADALVAVGGLADDLDARLVLQRVAHQGAERLRRRRRAGLGWRVDTGASWTGRSEATCAPRSLGHFVRFRNPQFWWIRRAGVGGVRPPSLVSRPCRRSSPPRRPWPSGARPTAPTSRRCRARLERARRALRRLDRHVLAGQRQVRRLRRGLRVLRPVALRRGRDAAARDDGARADPRARARPPRPPARTASAWSPRARGSPSATSRRSSTAPGSSPSRPTSSAARRSAT